eukprot:4133656-Prymnesium_polylepis.1
MSLLSAMGIAPQQLADIAEADGTLEFSRGLGGGRRQAPAVKSAVLCSPETTFHSYADWYVTETQRQNGPGDYSMRNTLRPSVVNGR